VVRGIVFGYLLAARSQLLLEAPISQLILKHRVNSMAVVARSKCSISSPFIQLTLDFCVQRQIVIFRPLWSSALTSSYNFCQYSFPLSWWSLSHSSIRALLNFYKSPSTSWYTTGLHVTVHSSSAVLHVTKLDLRDDDFLASWKPLCIGIPYFCDWKPGRFRTTSRVRCLWFTSHLKRAAILDSCSKYIKKN